MKKPTIEDIQRRYAAYESYYNTLHGNQRSDDDYYELVFSTGVPKRYEERIPSTARDWIDVGIRHFTLDNPKSKVFLRNDSDAARRQVEKMETLYNFWLRKDIMAIKDAAKKLLLRGEVFLRINMDDTFFGRSHEDAERLFHFPLSLTVPDPINVYASPAHNGLIPADVIEKFKITVAEAELFCELNGWNWTSGKSPDATVEWMSYYSNKWRCFLIDKEPILPSGVQENILNICPYVHVASGSGQTSYEGKPEYLYRSIIYGKHDMLKMEARTLSQIDAINSRYAWIRHKIRAGDPEVARRHYPSGLPTDPDEILFEIPGVMEIDTLQGETPPQGLYQQQAMIQGYSHPPQVLGGIRPVGVYSGQHQETLMATAKPIYKDAFKNLEDALGISMGIGARVLENVYRSPLEVKNFASDSTRNYMRVTPNDISGHYDCEVKLLAEPPEATDNRKALGKSLRQGGSISHITELREYQDMSQKEAEDEMAQMAAEAAMQDPSLQGIVARNAVSRLGMAQTEEAMDEAEQNALKPMPPIMQGENYTGSEMVRKRGRTSPELESRATPREMEVT